MTARASTSHFILCQSENKLSGLCLPHSLQLCLDKLTGKPQRSQCNDRNVEIESKSTFISIPKSSFFNTVLKPFYLRVGVQGKTILTTGFVVLHPHTSAFKRREGVVIRNDYLKDCKFDGNREVALSLKWRGGGGCGGGGCGGGGGGGCGGGCGGGGGAGG
jgi:hypothetical protein